MITQFHQMVIARKKVSYNPSLVNVRRSSDSAEQVYLLSELTDGEYLSAELVTNGGFDTDTVWSKGSGWSIGSGVADSSIGGSYIYQAGAIVTASELHIVEVDVTETSGDPKISIQDGDNVTLTRGSDHYRAVLDSGSATGGYFLFGTGAFIGSIDNVSVREWSQSTVEGVVGAGNEGYVDTWLDQGSLGNNASQATTTNQPLLVENGALVLDSAGNAAMSVDTGDHFDGDAGLSFGTGDVTVCLGLDFGSGWVPAGHMNLFYTHSTGNNRMRTYINTTVGRFTLNFTDSGGAGSSVELVPTVPITAGYHHIAIALDRDDVATLYVDGVANGTVDISTKSGIDIGAGNANVYTLFDDTDTVGKASHFSAYYSLLDASAVSDHYDAVTAGTVYGSPEVWLSLPPASALP